jgi:hypothetical protein
MPQVETGLRADDEMIQDPADGVFKVIGLVCLACLISM